MHIRDDALRGPAARTVRKAALALLADVREQRSAMERDGDAESLHDFRVAVRRLRSWMRAFDDVLDDTLPRKHVRHLDRLAQATGDRRDLDVHIEWVDRIRRAHRGDARHGIDLLRARLEDRRAKADVVLQRAIDDEFERVVRGLERSFARYTASVADRPPTFASVSAALVRGHASELAGALSKVSTIGDRAQAHAARIAAKRLRYLLAPLDKAIEDAAPAVDELTALQDKLGELHDAQIFGGEIALMTAEVLAEDSPDDAMPGLAAMSRRLHKTEAAAFAAIHVTWLHDGAAPLRARTERIAAELERIGTAGREIERKYLLRALPDVLPDVLPPGEVLEIDQGYLPGTRLIERIRRVRSAAGVAYYRTVKVGTGVDRLQLEEETTKRVYDALWPLTAGCRVRKQRHRIEDGARTWEIDVFLDRELVLAEVELDDRHTVPDIPEWLEAAVERDVTGEEAYTNRALAR